MTARFTDEFPDHPKVLAAGPSASWLHVLAIHHAIRALTDGYVPARVLVENADRFSGVYLETDGTLPGIPVPARVDELAERLVDVGLWELTADGGWQIHDFAEYQTTRAARECQRERERERKRRARMSQRDVRVGQAPHTRAHASAHDSAPLEPKTIEAGPTPQTPLPNETREVYDFWREARSKTRPRYAQMSPARRDKIAARLREFTVDELKEAIAAVALDPWPERARHDDLIVILRSREQVERFLAFAENPELTRTHDPSRVTVRDILAPVMTPNAGSAR